MKIIRISVYSFFLFLIATTTYASDTELLKLAGDKISVPDKYFTLRGFKDFQSRPFPIPDAYSSQGGKTIYKALDIWRHNQSLGRWANSKIELTLAEMTMGPLKNLDSLVPEADISNYSTGTKASLDNAGEWLEMFTEGECDEEVKSYINPDGIKFSVYSLNTGSGNSLTAFVSNNYSVSGNPLVFIYSMKTKPDKFEKSLIYNSVKTIKIIQRTSEDNIRKADSTESTNNDIASVNTADFVRQSLKNMKDWYGMEYNDFIIVTNLQKDARFLPRTKSELVICWKLFNFFYPDTETHKDKCIVRIFKNHDDYKAYVGNQFAATGGLWMPSKKELALSSTALSRQESSNSLRQVLLHEAFHQYLYYAVQGIYTPPWFNEGNSAFFEGTKFTGSRTTIGPVQRYLDATIDGIKKDKFDLKKLLTMNYEEFYSPDNIKYNYSFGWALIYFLQKGAPVVKQICGRDYTGIPDMYYRELCRSGSDAVASEKAWKDVNIEQLSADFKKFYSSKSPMQRAESYDIVGARKNQ